MGLSLIVSVIQSTLSVLYVVLYTGRGSSPPITVSKVNMGFVLMSMWLNQRCRFYM